MSKNYLEIGIYYYIDDETGKKVYDEEEMLSEFENKLNELLNQNKDDYLFTRVSVEERQRERSDKYDYLIGDDDDIKPNQNKDEKPKS